MRVVIIGGTPGYTGGVETFCARMTQAFKQHGGLEVENIPTSSAYFKPKQLPGLLRSLIKLASHRRKKPIVWLQHSNVVDLIFVLAAKLFGLKVIVTPHIGPKGRSQANRRLRDLSQKILSKADLIALISKSQEEEIELPHAVPRSYIRTYLPRQLGDSGIRSAIPIKSTRRIELIHAGRLSADKGSFRFLEVCRDLQIRNVNFHATIAGGADSETMGELKRQVECDGLAEKVTILGLLPPSEMPALLEKSDYLIHLSTIDSYPLIVLEALACGVYPICIDLPGARNLVASYTGCIVSELNSVTSTLECLLKLNLNSTRAEGLTASQIVRSDYDWQACVNIAVQSLISVSNSHKHNTPVPSSFVGINSSAERHS